MTERDNSYFTSDEVTRRDPIDQFAREQEAAYGDMPAVNVLVAGPAGVGKSTLVNAVLRKPVARTGKGRPVTQEIRSWSVEGVPITVYDTPGLELTGSANVVPRILDFVREQLGKDASEHLHVLWYCVHAQGNRFQDAETTFLAQISDLLPSIVVLTQCFGDEDEETKEFAHVLRSLLDEHHVGVTTSSPLLSLALPRKVGPHEFQPFGLRELVDETYDLLPEGAQRAFVNAQGIDLELKRREGRKVVAQHATAAAAIGAVPIPIPDAGPLLGIQATMLARTTVVMGVEFDDATRNFLIRGVLGSGSLVQIGRQATSMLLKLVPGLGSAINASVAAAITGALGEAYISLCVEFIKRERAGRTMPSKEMLDLLMRQFKDAYRRS